MAENESDDSQKTEDPTQKRLEEARKKGQIAVSRELNTWLMLLAATILVGTSAPGMMKALREHLKPYLEHPHDFPQVPGGLSIILGDSFLDVLMIMAFPLMVLMAVAFIGPFLQTGPLFAPEVIKPDISKISPVKGFSRLFSKRSLMEFVKGLLKLAAVGIVGFMTIKPYYGQIDHFIGLPVPLLLDEIASMVMRLLTGILIILLVISIVDVVYQRHEHYKKMRMTKQELKDEYKQSEGDPMIKGKLRQLRAEKARQRMMQAVPRADVVITNPTHFAIALEYKPETMDAPVCIAKGADDVALRIRELAREHNIVIYENKPLARVLYETVEIDDVVPAEHYKAVAEVISYVFKLKGKIR